MPPIATLLKRFGVSSLDALSPEIQKAVRAVLPDAEQYARGNVAANLGARNLGEELIARAGSRDLPKGGLSAVWKSPPGIQADLPEAANAIRGGAPPPLDSQGFQVSRSTAVPERGYFSSLAADKPVLGDAPPPPIMPPMTTPQRRLAVQAGQQAAMNRRLAANTDRIGSMMNSQSFDLSQPYGGWLPDASYGMKMGDFVPTTSALKDTTPLEPFASQTPLGAARGVDVTRPPQPVDLTQKIPNRVAPQGPYRGQMTTGKIMAQKLPEGHPALIAARTTPAKSPDVEQMAARAGVKTAAQKNFNRQQSEDIQNRLLTQAMIRRLNARTGGK